VLGPPLQHPVGGPAAIRRIGLGQEGGMAGAGGEEAAGTGGQDDGGERHRQQEDAREGQGRHHHQHPVLQGALADAQHRLDHHRQHRRLQPEQQPLDHGHLVETGVEAGQPHHHHEAGQHEQCAGHHAAQRAVKQPADINGELLRLGAGQQHAIVECVEEPRLADPAFFIHQDAVHGGDLPGRAAETQQADPEPYAQGFGQGGMVDHVHLFAAHAPAPW
jgi:hypothetical protein